MLRIAICDDEISEIKKLCEFIDAYAGESADLNIKYEYFISGIELISRITAGVYYDCIFLDIVMPVINGIDTAKEIFETNNAVQIIFLTSSPEFAVDSYGVCALDYILKPLTAEKFQRAMKKLSDKLAPKKSREIIIRNKKAYTRISLNNLEFVDVYGHDLSYHMSGREIITVRQKLIEIEDELLKHEQFIKPHRSYIVNMDYIESMDLNFFVMTSGATVPISRTNYQTFSDLFLKYRFKKGGKVL